MKLIDYKNDIAKYFRDVTIPENLVERDYTALIMVHTLAYGGSQVAIESIIPILQEEQSVSSNDKGQSFHKAYSIFVISYEDGPYRKIYEDLGVACALTQTWGLSPS